jgi:hypothetical protein
MVRSIVFAATLAFVAGSFSPALAAPCRDAKGKFIKCANATPSKPVRCKGATGKFAKCGSPGAKPV